ncbi:hypothetical protein FGG08_002231 [Glutinoglossum americanum]|uniref:UBC core domain-containing protein n=1 Tax=Glutinoglossum americanum TaxID=1670608 RepID=A0A9P8I9R7_9PEZI|nr:hypothetical protein FGG08_002231 [Glutinoglossum americanum]
MSSSSDRPPDPAHVASPHFLRNRGRAEKRKSESPLAADTMVRTGLIGRGDERSDEQEQERGDRGGSPTKKVKRSSRFSPASASSSSLLVNGLDSEAQVKLSKLSDLERDAFLARKLQDQLDKPLLKEPAPLSPKSEAKRQTQLALDEDLARALMEEEMREAGNYPSDSDVVMTDDSQLDVFDNSDEEFNDASIYDGAAGDWNDVENYASDTEEEKTIKTELAKAAAGKSGDLPSSGKSNFQLFRSISGMEDIKREETEKMFKELLEHAEKGTEKQRENGNRRRSSLNASRSSMAPQGDPTSTKADLAHGSGTNSKPREVIDLTIPCEPSPSVAKLQQWYSSQRLNLNCRTCHGDLTIDASNAAELIRLWTGTNFMAKTPENTVPPIPNRANFGRRLRPTPSRTVSESAPTVADMGSKGEEATKELSYLNLFGTAKCKGSCTKVSCLQCGAHCEARTTTESPTWHCEASRPLSLLVILGALDEWVLKGKKEDAVRRRKSEYAGYNRELNPDKRPASSRIPQPPYDAVRRPYETKLRDLLESEADYGAWVQKMEGIKRTMSGICELKRILDNSKMTFKETWANEESLKGTLKLMETKLGTSKAHLISDLDTLVKQKQSQSTTLLSRIRKHAGDNRHDDHLVKPLDTMRTTRSMSAKMAGLKDRILSKSSTAASKQEKKKSLFGHAQKTNSDNLAPLGVTPKYPNSGGFSDGVLYTKSSAKSSHGSWSSKYKKPNGTGYGGGPYYSSYHDMEEFEDYDSLEEYADSLASPTDSVLGASPDAAEISTHQNATTKQPKASDTPKPPPHKLSMVEAFHDFMAEYVEEAKTPGLASFKPDDLTLEASPTKGTKPAEWACPTSPGSLSDLAWRPPVEGNHQFDHPFTKQLLQVDEGSKAYVDSLTANKKMPIVFGYDTQSLFPHHKYPSSVYNSLPHPRDHSTNPKLTPSAVERIQQFGSGDGETSQKKAPPLIDLSSGDEAKQVHASHSSFSKGLKYGRASERPASKPLESNKQTAANSLKMGGSANDSIVIDPDSDEGSSASKSFRLAQRSASTGAAKKTTLQPQLANGVQGQQNFQHRSAPLSPLHSPVMQNQSAFQLPPILSSVTRSSTGQHQMNTGAPNPRDGPIPQPHLHQPGTFLPYTSFHTPSSIHSGNAKVSAHLNSSTKPQGHGWDMYTHPLENYAQTHSGAIPHLPFQSPLSYGPLPGFTQMTAKNGPPSSFGSNWAHALNIPPPPEPPIPPYMKPSNGSEISWTQAWPSNTSPHVPPPPSRRVARVASIHVERRNLRQEHQDKVLRSMFKMLTEAMPKEYDLPSHHTYPVDVDILLTMLNASWLGEKMEELLRNDSMTDISKRSDLYVALLGLTRRIGQCTPIASFLGLPREIKRMSSGLLKIAGCEGELELENDTSTTLWELLEKLVKQARVIMKGLGTSDYQDIEGEDMSTIALCVEIVSVFESMQPSVEWSKQRAREQVGQSRPRGNGKGKQKASDDDLKKPSNTGSSLEESAQSYRQRQMRFHQNHSFEHINDFTSSHYHMTEIQSLRHSPKGRIMHLTKELATMATSLPEGIFVRVSDGRPDVIKCLIIGPEGTPYEGGLFEFDVWCPEAYPNCPPKCQLKTTGGGTVGFNPNLYPDGKGTWSGAPSEMWQPRLSTLLQVFISIQSMILCPKPYYNEPGRVEPSGRDSASENFNNYVKDVVKEHFTINGAKILETVTEWSASAACIKSYDPRDAHSWRTHRSWTRAGKGRNLLEELESGITAVAAEDAEPGGKTKA